MVKIFSQKNSGEIYGRELSPWEHFLISNPPKKPEKIREQPLRKAKQDKQYAGTISTEQLPKKIDLIGLESFGVLDTDSQEYPDPIMPPFPKGAHRNLGHLWMLPDEFLERHLHNIPQATNPMLRAIFRVKNAKDAEKMRFLGDWLPDHNPLLLTHYDFFHTDDKLPENWKMLTWMLPPGFEEYYYWDETHVKAMLNKVFRVKLDLERTLSISNKMMEANQTGTKRKRNSNDDNLQLQQPHFPIDYGTDDNGKQITDLETLVSVSRERLQDSEDTNQHLEYLAKLSRKPFLITYSDRGKDDDGRPINTFAGTIASNKRRAERSRMTIEAYEHLTKGKKDRGEGTNESDSKQIEDTTDGETRVVEDADGESTHKTSPDSNGSSKYTKLEKKTRGSGGILKPDSKNDCPNSNILRANRKGKKKIRGCLGIIELNSEDDSPGSDIPPENTKDKKKIQGCLGIVEPDPGKSQSSKRS